MNNIKVLKILPCLLIVACTIFILMVLWGQIIHLPYHFHIFVRWFLTISFAILAIYDFLIKKNILLACTFILLLVLFNPVYGIHFTRVVWQCIDIVVMCMLVWFSMIHFPKSA
ncbi:MAG: hypothetical protein GY756_24935 [bacterium]|nr:hypothetical protein [bacterium]